MWWPFKRKKFCETCGSSMQWNKYLDRYDGNTGKDKYFKSWRCSKDHRHSDWWEW